MVALGGRGRGGGQAFDFPHQGAELVGFEEMAQGGRVRGAHGDVGQAGVREQVGAQPGQPPIGKDIVEMRFELFAGGRLDGVEMVAHVLQGGVGAQHVQGGLGPDAGHARNVVAGVADQRLQVGPRGRGDAALGFQIGPGGEFFRLARRVVEHDCAVQALLEVLVRADDDHRPGAAEPGGQARDAVVGLGALGHDDRKPEQAHAGEHRFDLRRQGLGHGFPVGLVIRENILAEGRTASVQEKHGMARGFVAQQAQQQAHDHVYGVGGEAVRPRDVAEGVVAPVEVGAAVDEEDRTLAETESLGQGHGAPCRNEEKQSAWGLYGRRHRDATKAGSGSTRQKDLRRRWTLRGFAHEVNVC